MYIFTFTVKDTVDMCFINFTQNLGISDNKFCWPYSPDSN